MVQFRDKWLYDVSHELVARIASQQSGNQTVVLHLLRMAHFRVRFSGSLLHNFKYRFLRAIALHRFQLSLSDVLALHCDTPSFRICPEPSHCEHRSLRISFSDYSHAPLFYQVFSKNVTQPIFSENVEVRSVSCATVSRELLLQLHRALLHD